ncbi:DUF2092 domain-containing protein [Solitalea canadensis]|uniref:Putative periplasmic protein n=1 Tax=Solitalea canadensis (strain ATCC 29591 / DSM 3403 / JCM 21819 / LMG 8368 / NBRC 15130 / NCIMB 12057 / USAM 9D) TaxID=929556 RepID=H8KVP7_SOLCM|nr:DUF2092 domain-containing protein [Solitalea canadensis]AFD06670.1 putative periplasmic protein [Solitalea canadensis DSM 3403]
MKRLLILVLFIPFSVFSQTKKVDTMAVLILDRMSNVIGDLESCSYDLSTASDELGEYGLVKHYGESKVYMVGPDKMLIQTKGDKGHRGYWYNGKQMTYYSYTENNFATMKAPSSIIATIDSLHEHYGIDFPAADFFYPTFSDDILDHFDKIVLVGIAKIEGKDCFHLLADSQSLHLQIWIANDGTALPMRFSIIYKSKDQSPQYEATFSNWVMNPNLPDILFEFAPPPGAHEITILAKTAKN